MNYIRVTILFILVSAKTLQGQPESHTPSSFFSVSYAGINLWNPGLSFSGEYPLSQHNSDRTEAKSGWEILLRGTSGFYLDPGSHAALYIHSGLSFRREGRKERSFVLSLQPAGIYRSFLTETYLYENGSISRVPVPGNHYYAPYAAIGVEKRSGVISGAGLFCQAGLITLIPYNTYVMPLAVVEIGYRFSGKRGGL